MLPFAPLPLPPLPEKPLVSVLVSCHNYEAYVVEAVQSALGQTYAPVEVVVVDDGSTDGSLALLHERFAGDRRVRIVAQANAGQAAAMNAAVAAAAGEVLCFLDADDTFMPDKCARVVDAFRQRSDAGVLAHGLVQVDGAGRVRATQRVVPTPGWQGEAILRRGGGVPAMPQTSALALRRAVADALFPLDASYRIAADVVVQRVAPLVTAIASIPEPLMRYRVHGANHFVEGAVTAQGVDRTLAVVGRSWTLQKAFLAERFGPGVAARLAPLSADDGWLAMRVQRAYLSGSGFAQAVRSFASHPESGASKHGRVARVAARLPGPLARGVWAVVFGEGVHKRILRALRGLRTA